MKLPSDTGIRERAMGHVVSTMLVVVGIIHLLPVAGVLGAERLVSVVSFLWFAWPVDGLNAAVRRVVLADAAALVCLAVGSATLAYASRRQTRE